MTNIDDYNGIIHSRRPFFSVITGSALDTRLNCDLTSRTDELTTKILRNFTRSFISEDST